MFYDKEIKTFHSYRAEVLEIVKNDFKEKCGCDFAENISFDQLPIKRGWHNHDRLDVYDNPHYYQSLIEK
jgi:hypothetical protein